MSNEGFKCCVQRVQRGQVFAVEFLVAFVLFAAVLAIMPVIYEDIRGLPESDAAEMNDVASRASYYLTEGPGYPTRWNASNVVLLGLAGKRGVLDSERIEKLFDVDYENATYLLGSGKYELYLRLKDLNGSTLKLGGISGLGRIAYTNADGNPDEGSAAKYGLRDWMETSNISFTNYGSNWTGLIDRINEYDTVIFEDPHLGTGIPEPRKTNFLNWVSNGGNYVQKEHGDIVTLFNVSVESDKTGRVAKLDSLLKGVAVGDEVSCREGYSISGNVNKLVVDYAKGNGMIASWNYGSGKVVYVCDTEGTVTGSVGYDNIRAALNFFGSTIEYGLLPANATKIVVDERTVAYEGNASILEVIIWK